MRDAITTRSAIPLIRLQGSHKAMGETHGQACRGLIVDLVRTVKEQLVGTEEGKALLLAGSMEPTMALVRQSTPGLFEEIEGIAEGAGISTEEALLLNCRLEAAAVSRRAQVASDGCSAFAVSSTALTGGGRGPLVAMNIDMAPPFSKHTVILELKPEDGPSILTLTLAGTVGLYGFNSCGLSRLGTGLFTRGGGRRPSLRVGLPIHIIARRILGSCSVDDALGVVEGSPRTLPTNHLLADTSDRVVDVETLPARTRTLACDGEYIAHTNTILDEELSPEDVSGETVPDSIERYRDLVALITQTRGFSLDAAKKILSDHNHAPASICRHAGSNPNWQTVASVIALPRQGVMLASDGNPCVERYAEYRLSRSSDG